MFFFWDWIQCHICRLRTSPIDLPVEYVSDTDEDEDD